LYVSNTGGQTHPRLLNSKNVEQFLTHLVVNRNVSASTQRQALNGLVFLYVKVLDMPFQGKIAPIRSKRHKRLPVVLTTEEVKVLRRVLGTPYLFAYFQF
jgi:site-specific recombinase XerD